MKTTAITVPALVLGLSLAVYAQTPTKVGIIHIQNAIVSTKDGQKAFNELQGRFAPKKVNLEKKQQELEARKAQLAKGANTMANDQKERLMRDIDQGTKSLNRDTEDAQAELDQEQGKVMQELGQRMMAVIDKYAKDNGYSLILDVSSQQTPVLYAANGIDITNDIVGMYDKNAPGGAAPPPAPKPAAAPPAVKKAPGTK
ncbi:MAG: OmpH family outer membrane protein [Bryobacteraceae bacterium]